MKTDFPVAILISLSIPVVFLIINFLLMPTILIETTPNRFTFTSGKIVQEIDTYFYVMIMDGKVRPCAIGEYYETSVPGGMFQNGAFRVDIFKVNDLLPAAVNRQDLLESFLQYGIIRCWDASRSIRLLMCRPRLIFRGVEAFDSIFSGQQQAAFKHAARAAGAISVKFEQLAV